MGVWTETGVGNGGARCAKKDRKTPSGECEWRETTYLPISTDVIAISATHEIDLETKPAIMSLGMEERWC